MATWQVSGGHFFELNNNGRHSAPSNAWVRDDHAHGVPSAMDEVVNGLWEQRGASRAPYARDRLEQAWAQRLVTVQPAADEGRVTLGLLPLLLNWRI